MTTFAELLSARRGDLRPGLVERDRSLTWDEVIAAASHRARWLSSQRSTAPPHLGILLPNGVEYVLWLFGAALAGWAVVGINPTRRGDALAADIRATDCQVVLTDEEGSGLLEDLDLGIATNAVLLTDQVIFDHRAGEPWVPPSASEEDLLLLLFTSGTTGAPKAVRCTQGRLAGIAESAAPAYGYTAQDVCYCPMPLFHGNALMALVGPSVLVGATIALRPRFSASSFLDDVRAFYRARFTRQNVVLGLGGGVLIADVSGQRLTRVLRQGNRRLRGNIRLQSAADHQKFAGILRRDFGNKGTMLRLDHHQPLKGQPVDGRGYRKARDIQFITQMGLVNQSAGLQCARQNGVAQVMIHMFGFGQALRGISISTAAACGAGRRAVDFIACDHATHQFQDFCK